MPFKPGQEGRGQPSTVPPASHSSQSSGSHGHLREPLACETSPFSGRWLGTISKPLCMQLYLPGQRPTVAIVNRQCLKLCAWTDWQVVPVNFTVAPSIKTCGRVNNVAFLGDAGQDPDAMAFISGLASGVPIGCSPAFSMPFGQDLASHLAVDARQMPMDLASALSGGSTASDHDDGSVHLRYDAAKQTHAVHAPGDKSMNSQTPILVVVATIQFASNELGPTAWKLGHLASM